MAQSSSVMREPTMDEILTSIREIIQENTAQAAKVAVAQHVNNVSSSVAPSNIDAATAQKTVAPSQFDTNSFNTNLKIAQNAPLSKPHPSPAASQIKGDNYTMGNFQSDKNIESSKTFDTLKKIDPLSNLPETQQNMPSHNEKAVEELNSAQQIVAQTNHNQPTPHNAPQTMADVQQNVQMQQSHMHQTEATHKAVAQNSANTQYADNEEKLRLQKMQELQHLQQMQELKQMQEMQQLQQMQELQQMQQMQHENLIRQQQEALAQQAQALENTPAPAVSVDDAMQALAARIGLGLEQEQHTAPAKSADTLNQGINHDEIHAAALQMQQINEIYQDKDQPQDAIAENTASSAQQLVAVTVAQETTNQDTTSHEVSSHEVNNMVSENETNTTSHDKNIAQPPLVNGFEAVAESALRPLIHQWLEQQLPHLIDKIVREEMTSAFEKQLASLNLTDQLK